MILSLDPVATKFPMALRRSSRGLGCEEGKGERDGQPHSLFSREQRLSADIKFSLVTHLDPTELANRRIRHNRSKDGDFNDVLVSSQLHFGLAGRDFPYAAGLRGMRRTKEEDASVSSVFKRLSKGEKSPKRKERLEVT
jgi:hypothetical protein